MPVSQIKALVFELFILIMRELPEKKYQRIKVNLFFREKKPLRLKFLLGSKFFQANPLEDSKDKFKRSIVTKKIDDFEGIFFSIELNFHNMY